MKYLAAYLLANLSGNKPDASAVTNVLTSIGIEVDAAQVEKVVSELSGKDLAAVIAEGSSKLSSVSVSVGAGAAAAPAAGGAAAASKSAAPAKEEKKEEEKEESDDDMGFGLFD
jgi:large subunit ribosomal protein LP2